MKLTRTGTVIIDPHEVEVREKSMLKRGTAFRGLEQAKFAFAKDFPGIQGLSQLVAESSDSKSDIEVIGEQPALSPDGY